MIETGYVRHAFGMCIATGLLLGASALGDPIVVYVDQNAPEPGNGASWPTAYTSLQSAIESAELIVGGDPNATCQIWVA